LNPTLIEPEDYDMATLAEKIEQRTNRSLSDMADDAAQGIALTGILAVFLAWAVMLLQNI